jgi:hypothetical protein
MLQNGRFSFIYKGFEAIAGKRRIARGCAGMRKTAQK